MTIRVTAEADARQGPGHAVILIEGARVAPDGVRFLIRRPGYRENSLGPTGWQAAEALLEPEAAYMVDGVLVLHLGPDIVAHMEPGMNVAFVLALPDGRTLDGQLAWPAIPGPIGGAGARRGRMVATQRAATEPAPLRSGGALIGDVAPVSRPAPRPAPPVATAAEQPPPLPDDALAPASTADAEAVTDAPEDAPAEEDLPADEAADDAPRRPDLRAERDPQAMAASRRAPWGQRVAVVATIALLLFAGAAAASVYFGRDEICASQSFGGLADDWGLCPPPVIVAEGPIEEAPDDTDPADADPSEEGDATPGDETADGPADSWNINPLSWLGPPATEPEAAARGAEADETNEAPPSPESQRALARQYLETEPTPEDAFARAGDLLADGQVEAAFLIYRYAAERGYADAATAVAAMYDPGTYTAQTSPLPRPNPSVARIWYERAVAAGDDEALISLARLLVAQDAVDEARAVLRRAEEAGLTEAAGRVLEELE
ncbi:MAG: hypothetical protein ACFCVH_14090 [Alphaproteobacteria bacterium]